MKLSLLKMLLVSNRESIRRNNRWKRKKKGKTRKISTRVQRDLKGWGGDDRRFSLNFSRGNVIGRRRCAEIERGYKLFKLPRVEKRTDSYLGFGWSRISKSLLRSIH